MEIPVILAYPAWMDLPVSREKKEFPVATEPMERLVTLACRDRLDIRDLRVILVGMELLVCLEKEVSTQLEEREKWESLVDLVCLDKLDILDSLVSREPREITDRTDHPVSPVLPAPKETWDSELLESKEKKVFKDLPDLRDHLVLSQVPLLLMRSKFCPDPMDPWE